MLTINLSRTERRLDESKQRESQVTHMNETLEKLDRLKTDFMHNIAHEMKTPLTVMSGYAQLTEKQIEKNVVNGSGAFVMPVRRTGRGSASVRYGDKAALGIS